MAASKVLMAAIATVLAMAVPAQGNVDVTLDIAGAAGGPTSSQGEPRTPARTGIDPLPLGSLAVFFIALGIMSSVHQSRLQRKEPAS